MEANLSITLLYNILLDIKLLFAPEITLDIRSKKLFWWKNEQFVYSRAKFNFYFYFFPIAALWNSLKCNVIQQIKHRVTIPCKWSFVLWKGYAENHLIKNHDNWFLHKIEENERGFPICKNVNNRESQASPPNVRTSLIGPQKYCRPITELLPFWHHNPWYTYF